MLQVFARGAGAVLLTGALVFAMPVTSEAFVGPIAPLAPLLIPEAAGTVTAVGTGVAAPPGFVIATAALGGFAAGYYGAAAVSWLWDQAFAPEASGGTYPVNSGACSIYNMGTFVSVYPSAPGDTGPNLRAYCTGMAANIGIIETPAGKYLYRVTGGWFEGGAETVATVGHAWVDTNGAVQYGLKRLSDATYVGGVDLPGNVQDGSTLSAPQHVIRTDVTCAGGSVVHGYSVTFTETDPVPTVPMPSCGAGVAPTAVSVREGNATGAGGTRGFDWVAPAAPGASDPLRDCYPGGSAAPCRVSLLKVVGSGYQACADAAVDCTSYNHLTSTGVQYQCRWGGHVVAVGQCEALQPLQLTPTLTPLPPQPDPVTRISTTTVTNPDGSTTTTEVQQLPDGSLQRVVTHGFPDGSRTITTTDIDVNGNPKGTPRVVTIPAPAPGGHPGPVPIPTPDTMPTPGPNPPDEANDCWPSGVAGWNPAEWVLRPVKCALTWAFVPRAATLNTLAGGARADMNRVGIAPLAAAVGSNFSLIGSGTGCDGPAVTFSAVGVNKVLHPFAACTAPMSTLAAISYAFSSVVIVAVGGFAAMRALGAGFGFNVSMGRGKGSDS